MSRQRWPERASSESNYRTRLRAVVVHKSGCALHLADDRIKGAIGVLRRAEIAQARVGLDREALKQCRREP
jgi:hypothetical protein